MKAKAIMVEKTSYFNRLIAGGGFRFDRLDIAGIDNEPVFRLNVPEMSEQETCLFHRDLSSGEDYLGLLHSTLHKAMAERIGMPIVRFADGEYAFYQYSLNCNGLYQQAENVSAIKQAMPAHIEAMRILSRRGKIAPLVFPGNTQKKVSCFLGFLHKSKSDDSAIKFLDFLITNGIELTGENYIPFYAVYAYLTSERFARLVDGKSICVINAEYKEVSLRRWFDAFASTPRFCHVSIPDAYVATRWGNMRQSVMSNIPEEVDLCLVGAGVGALEACVDISERFSVVAVDAGHVMNMMNGRVDKSGGPRLYTLWK